MTNSVHLYFKTDALTYKTCRIPVRNEVYVRCTAPPHKTHPPLGTVIKDAWIYKDSSGRAHKYYHVSPRRRESEMDLIKRIRGNCSYCVVADAGLDVLSKTLHHYNLELYRFYTHNGKLTIETDTNDPMTDEEVRKFKLLEESENHNLSWYDYLKTISVAIRTTGDNGRFSLMIPRHTELLRMATGMTPDFIDYLGGYTRITDIEVYSQGLPCATFSVVPEKTTELDVIHQFFEYIDKNDPDVIMWYNTSSHMFLYQRSVYYAEGSKFTSTMNRKCFGSLVNSTVEALTIPPAYQYIYKIKTNEYLNYGTYSKNSCKGFTKPTLLGRILVNFFGTRLKVDPFEPDPTDLKQWWNEFVAACSVMLSITGGHYCSIDKYTCRSKLSVWIVKKNLPKLVFEDVTSNPRKRHEWGDRDTLPFKKLKEASLQEQKEDPTVREQKEDSAVREQKEDSTAREQKSSVFQEQSTFSTDEHSNSGPLPENDSPSSSQSFPAWSSDEDASEMDSVDGLSEIEYINNGGALWESPQIGIHRSENGNVIEQVDMGSYYPTTIITNNLDPSTVLRRGPTSTTWYFVGDGSKYDGSLDDLIPLTNTHCALNPTFRTGHLPKIMTQLISQRNIAKSNMKKAVVELDLEKRSRLHTLYDTRNKALKLAANMLLGMVASQYDQKYIGIPEIGALMTEIGRVVWTEFAHFLVSRKHEILQGTTDGFTLITQHGHLLDTHISEFQKTCRFTCFPEKRESLRGIYVASKTCWIGIGLDGTLYNKGTILSQSPIIQTHVERFLFTSCLKTRPSVSNIPVILKGVVSIVEQWSEQYSELNHENYFEFYRAMNPKFSLTFYPDRYAIKFKKSLISLFEYLFPNQPKVMDLIIDKIDDIMNTYMPV